MLPRGEKDQDLASEGSNMEAVETFEGQLIEWKPGRHHFKCKKAF